MTWDAESRISTVGGATYVYDPLGQRVGKQGRRPHRRGLLRRQTDRALLGRPVDRPDLRARSRGPVRPAGRGARHPDRRSRLSRDRPPGLDRGQPAGRRQPGQPGGLHALRPGLQVFSTGRPFLVRCISASRYPARVLGRRWQFCRARWSTTCRLMTIWAAAAPCIENRPFTTANQRAF